MLNNRHFLFVNIEQKLEIILTIIFLIDACDTKLNDKSCVLQTKYEKKVLTYFAS